MQQSLAQLRAAQHQFSGVAFDGPPQHRGRDVIEAKGRRTPDSTVAQRHFRFAFILVVAPGTQPSAADLAQWTRTASSSRHSTPSGIRQCRRRHLAAAQFEAFALSGRRRR